MKDCLIICNKNCITYADIFPLLKDNILTIGSPVKTYENTEKKFGNHGWITTLPTGNKKALKLTQRYNESQYPKYDNFNAINVDRIKDIPMDYTEAIGVPITIFEYNYGDKYDVVGCGCHRADNLDNGYWLGGLVDATVNGDKVFFRIFIKKKQ